MPRPRARRRWRGEVFPRRSDLARCKRKAKGRSDTGRESVPVRRRRRNPEGVEDSKDSPRDNASGAGGESR
jgi:hypothetical protein